MLEGQALSPSARKVWIEISSGRGCPRSATSPSARKVWIEILLAFQVYVDLPSPSARKVWIEIWKGWTGISKVFVTFRKEGVD